MTEVTANTAANAESTETTGEVVAKKTRAPKTNLLDIARGRLALPFVHAIRFLEPKEATNSALAKKYATSVGKIFDIRKNANFTYVTEGYVFCADDINTARAYAVEAGNHGGDKETLLAFVETLTVGSAEALAAQDAAKPKKVMPPRTPKEPVLDADGNPVPPAPKAPRKPKAAKPEAAPVDGDALLS